MSSLAIDTSRFTAFNAAAQRLNILPVKVTPHYQRLVEAEHAALGHLHGPLARVVFPADDRLQLRAPHEVPDFVEDRTNMPADLHNVLIHKYRRRALFLVTDRCAGHCMYCFRQDVLSHMHAETLPAMQQKLDAVVDYLAEHPQVSEIILSGGDPLNVPVRYLTQILQRLRSETGVRDIRVHTRNVVFAPRVLSEEVCALLGAYEARLYLHVVHPYELTPEVTSGIARLQQHGVRTYSQFPILRGINDHLSVLDLLLRRLDALRANPINVFIPDPISYSAAFRMPLTRLFRLLDELYWETSSWTNGVRLVLDTPIGKVRREDIVAWDRASGVVTFAREGQPVVYHDFPEALDLPGDPAVLLWKGDA